MKKIILLFSLALMAACSQKEQADLIFLGGNIYTANPEQPTAKAVCVKDGIIVFVGDESEARKMKGKKTEIIDLGGMTMTPGFIESHGHLLGFGYFEMQVNLLDIANFDELVTRVKAAADTLPEGTWILGRGWHQDKWNQKPDTTVESYPLHDALSRAVPNHPVYLKHASGHAALANSLALDLAGIDAFAKEFPHRKIEGGEILTLPNGRPTGILIERAQGLVAQLIPKKSPESDRKALELAMKRCLENGITSFHDAGAKRHELALYLEYQKENKLPLRLYAMVSGEDSALVYEWFDRGIFIDDFLTIRAVKLHCDGALGSHGAWLLEEYTDRHGHFGHATLSMDFVSQISVDALKHGFQVCAHAIGERTNREILDRYEHAFLKFPERAKNHRYRIEHAQHIHPDDIPRFGQLGVIAAMQAIHMSSDRPWAINKLGQKRIEEGAYMWQALLQSGAVIANGSDVPVEPINPIASFYASVTRKTLDGKPEGGFEPSQKMTREQALRSYTLDAAFAAFEEDKKGSIEVGKFADFTVFSADLMTVPERELLNVEVMRTIVAGKTVFEATQSTNSLH